MVWNATDRSGNVAEATFVVLIVPPAGVCYVRGRVLQTLYSLSESSCAAVQLNLTWTTSAGVSQVAVEVTWAPGVTTRVTPAPGATSLLVTHTYSSTAPQKVSIKLMNGCTSSMLEHPISIRAPTGEH
jgi:hypothetical protein